MSCGDGTVAPPNEERDTDMKFLPWIIHHHRRVIALTLLLVAVAAAGLAHLQQTADYRIYFNPNDPHLAAAEALQATYTRSDNVLFVIAPKTGEVFTTPVLASVQAPAPSPSPRGAGGSSRPTPRPRASTSPSTCRGSIRIRRTARSPTPPVHWPPRSRRRIPRSTSTSRAW